MHGSKKRHPLTNMDSILTGRQPASSLLKHVHIKRMNAYITILLFNNFMIAG
jgi:hypothetical protein